MLKDSVAIFLKDIVEAVANDYRLKKLFNTSEGVDFRNRRGSLDGK